MVGVREIGVGSQGLVGIKGGGIRGWGSRCGGVWGLGLMGWGF